MASEEGDVPTKLSRYQVEREVEALKLQSAARNRMAFPLFFIGFWCTRPKKPGRGKPLPV